MQTNTQKEYGVPIAIVVAGLTIGALVAGAIIFTGNENVSATAADNTETDSQPAGDFRLPNEDDHIRGDPDAPITIVEFSDLECQFCARLHPTLTRIVEENDNVNWAYRHFPLSNIHSQANSSAVASECIARLGDNENFWSFVDSAFENQRNLSESWYEEKATSYGIKADEFQSCLEDSSIASEVSEDREEAVGNGGRGTPYVVVVTKDGNLMPFSGALPYTQVSNIIEQARNN